MVSFIEPETLAKFGRSNKDVSQKLVEFNPDFRVMREGIKTIIKYILYSENPQYLLVLSQNTSKNLRPDEHNLVLTITSEDTKLNEEIFKKFSKKTGFEFWEANEWYSTLVKKGYKIIFEEIKADNGALLNKIPRIKKEYDPRKKL
ncbi:MAG: hypothetical protein QXP53_02945 [Candidatus Pacearchaeota archaeon]